MATGFTSPVLTGNQGYGQRHLNAQYHCNGMQIPTGGGGIESVGIYDDDTEALLDGNLQGDWYELSATNTYGMPAGVLKRIVEDDDE